MSFLSSFFTWDQVSDYVSNTLHIDYLQDPTSWTEAVRELCKGNRYVKYVNDVTGETWGEYVPENFMEGVGEIHVGENYSGPQTITGGAKSAPTAKSVITDSQTQTAVITDEAVGVKDVGIVQNVKVTNVIGALMLMYGIYTTAKDVANSKVWKDMCNAVFDTDFTEATPIEVLDNFLDSKLAVFTSVDNDEICSYIPDNIAEKMYTFLATHMVDSGLPVIQPAINFTYIYRWFDREFHPSSSYPNYDFSRYLSCSNPTDVSILEYLPLSDDLLKAWLSDFITSAIAFGIIVPTNTADAIMYSLEGVSAEIIRQARQVANCNFISFYADFARAGGSQIPGSQIAMSEFQVTITFFKDTNANTQTVDDRNYVTGDFNTYRSDFDQYLAPGESTAAGDCVKYIKRNASGASDNDYGYMYRIDTTPASKTYYNAELRWPANELTVNVSSQTGNTPQAYFINGYNLTDYEKTKKFKNFRYYSSNIGLTGNGIDYTPDDYLVRAGFRKNKNDKNPSPQETKEARYNLQKKQVANPQYNRNTGNVDNSAKDYTSAPVIFGSDNAKRILEHGINDPDDPSSYGDQRNQDEKERGNVNTNDPTDGFNEDTQDAIDEWDKTRNDPEHYPDPIPENEPNPEYPTDPPGGEDEGDTGDEPEPGIIEGVTASGMVSVYNPTKAQLISFSGWLWSHNFLDNFMKIFQNPMDAIIGLHIFYGTPHTTTPSNIIVGYLDSGVSAKVVDQQFTEVDCGTVTVPEYYGNATDYEPYTQIHAYLPFIGIVSLKPNDVIGKRVNIKYGIDVLTGTCLAIITTFSSEENKIACYNFAGNCAVQIPISGGNYAQVITSLAGFLVGAAGAVATANPIMALGAGVSLMNTHLDVSHSGSIGSNAGAMGVRKPYLIITRKSAYNAANYAKYYGFPANRTVVLGTCSGYTRVKAVHVDSMGVATDAEVTEIENLLRQGVIIK